MPIASDTRRRFGIEAIAAPLKTSLRLARVELVSLSPYRIRREFETTSYCALRNAV
jgi:hypothetical protein